MHDLEAENAALRRRIAEMERRLAKAESSARGSGLGIETLLDKLPGMVYRCRNDQDWTMDYVSSGALALTGWTPEDLRAGRITYNSLIHPDDRARVWDDIQYALAEERDFELVYRIRTADATIKWVWERGWEIWSETGALQALEGFIADISHHKLAEQALRESERRYRHLVEHSQEGIWMLDRDNRTSFVNSRLAAMLGYEVDELLGKSLFELMTPEWRELTRGKLGRPAPDTAEQHDLKLLRRDGREIWALVSVNPLFDEHEGHQGTIAMVVDITDRKHMEAALHELAISDPLTGLLNRRHFYSLAQKELQRFQRYQNPLAAIMMDLDHFKSINDRLGHLTGDQVLQTVARILRDSLRQTDILCRYGGEEFAILLPETDLRTASVTAERLRQTLGSEPIETDQGPLQLTVSLGVAGIYSWRDISVEDLLDHADRMLYAAKEGGRNQVAVWDLSTNRKVRTKPKPTAAR